MCVIYGCSVKPFIVDLVGKEKEFICSSFIDVKLLSNEAIIEFIPKECEGIKRIGLNFENIDYEKRDFNINIFNRSYSNVKIHWVSECSNSTLYNDIPIRLISRMPSHLKKFSKAESNFQFYVELSELEEFEEPIVLEFS